MRFGACGVWGFRLQGFRVSGFQGLGFRVQGLNLGFVVTFSGQASGVALGMFGT